ncbi:NfeD family protein [Limobrevibacterium gyesilva]|uniref:NfeD family protein n=1 Tax=Limobrevibacterium gyesilva TaxID=2991712 RepID=A0AA41YQN1_9PROT|nr:NfeD family protein [Limobrevibacterium gyesilva]MCW3476797.1 NfeD family protein [Limobrevibacterium gyesilva]
MIAAHPALAWLAAGLALLVIEVVAPGVYMMWLGLAALGTGGVMLLVAPGFGWQVAVFAAFAAASIGVALRLRRATRTSRLNTAESGLVGRSARALSFQGREGRVRVGDSDWTARLAAGAPVPETGAVLRVVGVDGTVLVVGPGPQPANG